MSISTFLRSIIGRKTHALNTIYLSARALLENYEYLQGLHPQDAFFAVIKSNAYGHGLKEIATILKDAPLSYLCVDSYPEYSIASKYNKHQYLVLSDTNSDNYRLYNWKRTSFVVSSFATLQYFVQKQKAVNIHIFLNTGLNREGFDTHELPELINQLKEASHITLEGVMSHLARADEIDMTSTDEQITRFKTMHQILVAGGFAPKYRHIGASAGTLTIQDPFFTARRVGKSLYGYSPLQEGHPKEDIAKPLQVCARVTSSLLTKRIVPTGESVGYGGKRTAENSGNIGLLPFGYYEGLPRGLTNQRSVKWGDIWLKSIGTISMNYSSVELGEHDIELGDEIEIFSADQSAPNSITAAASILRTNNYEIMVKRNEKIRRVIGE